jgi:hypothetical protein
MLAYYQRTVNSSMGSGRGTLDMGASISDACLLERIMVEGWT